MVMVMVMAIDGDGDGSGHNDDGDGWMPSIVNVLNGPWSMMIRIVSIIKCS